MFLRNSKLQIDLITDAKVEIDKLKVFVFPTNIIVDKGRVVIDVYGEISKSEKRVINFLKQLL